MTLSVSPPVPSRFADLLVLMKLRLNSLVVFTTAGGFYMAANGTLDAWRLLAVCVATALVASGAAGVNQVTERDIDRLMNRTRSRPVAAGRMLPRRGLAISIGLAAIGFAGLWWFGTVLSVLVAGVTFGTYIAVYTPLKRHTSLATVVGAVPGALPPLIGWTAAGGGLGTVEPWTLFLVMFLWQLPHFLAISWLYREDYARAGLPMLAVIDRDGAMTGRQAMLWAASIVPVALLPAALRLTGPAYGVGALVLGLALFAVSVRFASSRSRANARLLFVASITYLPLLWVLMAATKN